jgi:hypothetical protein
VSPESTRERRSYEERYLSIGATFLWQEGPVFPPLRRPRGRVHRRHVSASVARTKQQGQTGTGGGRMITGLLPLESVKSRIFVVAGLRSSLRAPSGLSRPPPGTQTVRAPKGRVAALYCPHLPRNLGVTRLDGAYVTHNMACREIQISFVTHHDSFSTVQPKQARWACK